MANRKKLIPKKLTNDAIVEAIFEIRFNMATLPEIFFGRITEEAAWKDFQIVKLPAYEIPASIREAESSFRFKPVIELQGADKKQIVRIGSNVISYHRYSPYVGWEKFKPELGQIIDGLFGRAEDIEISRLGFRYMNALNSELHGISSIADLDLQLVVESEDLVEEVNVNFRTDHSENIASTVRVATNDFVNGDVPPNTVVVIDVDVYTKVNCKTKDINEVKNWISIAHDKEKEQFFRLLTQDSINRLEEK